MYLFSRYFSLFSSYFLSASFFQIHERDGVLGFLNTSLGYTFKFFPIHYRLVGKLGFLRTLAFLVRQIVRIVFQAQYVNFQEKNVCICVAVL